MKIANYNLEERVFIIAEMSANHGGDINVALETVKAAKEAGADAIKIQTYTPDTITIDCDNEYFRINNGTIWDGDTLYGLYQKAYTPWEWHKQIMDYAKEIGIICFSSPFDVTAVDFLEELDVVAYKIASFEITDIPLIRYTASKGKPIIISTGIATPNDIYDAVMACRQVGNDNIILLKCTSEYPSKIEDANLATVPNIKQMYGVEVGVSDHTQGYIVPIVAVSLGARVIEKHFILDREIGGPDASFSMTKDEFAQMVIEVRQAEKAIGRVVYSTEENKSRKFARSLFVVSDVKEGEVFTNDNVRSIRPADGIAPKHLYDIIGKVAKTDIKKGTPVTIDMI